MLKGIHGYWDRRVTTYALALYHIKFEMDYYKLREYWEKISGAMYLPGIKKLKPLSPISDNKKQDLV